MNTAFSFFNPNSPVTFEVFKVVMMAFFWVLAPCWLANRSQHFGGPCDLHLQGWSCRHGDSTVLQSTGIYRPVHAVPVPKRISTNPCHSTKCRITHLTLGSSTDTTRQASASCLLGVKCLAFGPEKASWKSEVICWASSRWIWWT